MHSGQEMLEMMRHAVADGKQWRNYYNTEVGSEAYKAWQILVGLGLAFEGRIFDCMSESGKQINFHVTDAGLKLLGYRKKKSKTP